MAQGLRFVKVTNFYMVVSQIPKDWGQKRNSRVSGMQDSILGISEVRVFVRKAHGNCHCGHYPE